MQTATPHPDPTRMGREHPAAPDPTPPDRERRAALPTSEAAAHLNRKPQTLRGWACLEDGPMRPLRINGRLAWPVADLKRVLGLTP